ncbi:MAG: LysM peptidoglycan-binding domain-containing protein, partial [Thermoanaerobaculia bacterium]
HENEEWVPTSESRSSYRVARGDTLYGIAAQYRTSVNEVKRLNDLRSSRIYPGQLLAVPSSE